MTSRIEILTKTLKKTASVGVASVALVGLGVFGGQTAQAAPAGTSSVNAVQACAGFAPNPVAYSHTKSCFGTRAAHVYKSTKLVSANKRCYYFATTQWGACARVPVQYASSACKAV